MTRRRAYDIDNLSNEARNMLQRQSRSVAASRNGTACSTLREPIPAFNEAPCETTIQGENNSFIVLGRDRNASRLSGYGGRGDTQASMIDMVVGRMSYSPRETTEDGEALRVDPNFRTDAARIYISQKTDIDENFSLASGTVGTSTARSGIGIKADQVRVIAREGIKLVTRTDMRNSQGGEAQAVYGVDIIAGNDDAELQPITKGGTLVEALDRLVHHLDKLNGIVHNMLMIQMNFNRDLTHHFHNSPFFGAPTSPSPGVVPSGIRAVSSHLTQVQTSLMSHKANLVSFKANYLQQSGSNYINSRYNNVN